MHLTIAYSGAPLAAVRVVRHMSKEFLVIVTHALRRLSAVADRQGVSKCLCCTQTETDRPINVASATLRGLVRDSCTGEIQQCRSGIQRRLPFGSLTLHVEHLVVG